MRRPVVAGPRGRLLVVLLACLAGVAVLGASSLRGTLVYYRTPTEVLRHPPASTQSFRLAGLVVAGSLRRAGNQVDFVLTDGARDIQVVHRGDTPQLLREGQGAVVEGTLDSRHVFHSHLVMVRHSNEYRPPPVRTAAP